MPGVSKKHVRVSALIGEVVRIWIQPSRMLGKRGSLTGKLEVCPESGDLQRALENQAPGPAWLISRWKEALKLSRGKQGEALIAAGGCRPNRCTIVFHLVREKAS